MGCIYEGGRIQWSHLECEMSWLRTFRPSSDEVGNVHDFKSRLKPYIGFDSIWNIIQFPYFLIVTRRADTA